MMPPENSIHNAMCHLIPPILSQQIYCKVLAVAFFRKRLSVSSQQFLEAFLLNISKICAISRSANPYVVICKTPEMEQFVEGTKAQ